MVKDEFLYRVAHHKLAMEAAVTSMNKWLNELALKKPHLFKHALSGALEGNQIKILDREYELIILANRTGTTIRGKKNSNQLIFDIPQSIMHDTEAKQKYIPSVISKMFAAEMEERIHSINGRTIQGKLGNVTLRSASSRWGSCTGRNDIMISNRLLLAPTDILDHVIIHELAHIVHKDHSIKFWRLVAAHDTIYESSPSLAEGTWQHIAFLNRFYFYQKNMESI
jgi:predicted metal-dependent hydrolase